jgi:hypothetical protein
MVALMAVAGGRGDVAPSAASARHSAIAAAVHAHARGAVGAADVPNGPEYLITIIS